MKNYLRIAAGMITLILGVLIGILANFLFQWIQAIAGWSVNRISISGHWGERINTGTERQCSIGRIRYDRWRLMWVFDGTNYENNGQPFCHWRTIASYLDRHNRVFYYVFLNTHENAAEVDYTGFGLVRLKKIGRKWMPASGAFAAGNPGECFRSHSMVSLNDMPNTQNEVSAIIHEKLGL